MEFKMYFLEVTTNKGHYEGAFNEGCEAPKTEW